MPTVLDDTPGTLSEDAAGKAPDGAAPEPEGAATEQRHCANCGAPLEEGQDWCLHCGTATPGALEGGRPRWRSLGIVLGVIAALVAGAATAAYAALNEGPAKHVHLVVAQTQAPPAAAAPTTPPPATPTPATPPPATPKVGTPTTIPPAPAPAAPAKPPKIPVTASTPKPASSTPSSGSKTTPSTPTKTTPATTPTNPAPPAPLVLDTNAASTYNPSGDPASWFGDPSLTIDGDTSTAWTAQVDPAIAPRMAVGVAIDLRSARRLSTLELITSTPGMTVQVFGANTPSLPSSKNSAWVALSGPTTVNSRHTQIKLDHSTTPFRFVLLWISHAPAGSVGTAQAPGRVDVNEIELFPAK
jgi:predicted nucleic acid-binding Zn ribbon protein